MRDVTATQTDVTEKPELKVWSPPPATNLDVLGELLVGECCSNHLTSFETVVQVHLQPVHKPVKLDKQVKYKLTIVSIASPPGSRPSRFM